MARVEESINALLELLERKAEPEGIWKASAGYRDVLAAELEMATNSIRRYLKVIESLGIIDTKPTVIKGEYKSGGYMIRILLPGSRVEKVQRFSKSGNRRVKQGEVRPHPAYLT